MCKRWLASFLTEGGRRARAEEISVQSTTKLRTLGSPKRRVPSAAAPWSEAGRGARLARRAPARPESPGLPRRAPTRGCGKASCSAPLTRFPVPPAPAARLPAAQDSSGASHPAAPRPRPARSAPSRHQSQPNRPSLQGPSSRVGALKPHIQRD